MNKAPDVIWLQWHEKNKEETESANFYNATWCQDKIYDHDIEYVRYSWLERAEAIEAAAKNLIAHNGSRKAEQAYNQLVDAVNAPLS